jgi:hypothetical protein
MGSFGREEVFNLKMARWRTLAAAAVADRKRIQRAPAAPRAPARMPVRHSLEPAEIAIPTPADFLDPEEDLAAKVVRAGAMSRGELLIPAPAPSGVAAQVLAAAETARSGGPQRPAPEGLAAAIIAAGAKRREPLGG